MDISKTIDVFNSLIVINNDRIEGYKTASEEAKETDLKMLFSDLCQTSIDNRKELVAEVKKLGGTPEEGTRITGKFFRAWMDLKAAITGDNRKAILDSCEYGEETILKVYKESLIQDVHELNSNEQNLLNKQYAFLKADFAKITHILNLIEEEKE
jgi:uncharacterized protein (TIGR02284 family)